MLHLKIFPKLFIAMYGHSTSHDVTYDKIAGHGVSR